MTVPEGVMEKILSEFEEKFRGIEQYGDDHKSRWTNAWVNKVKDFLQKALQKAIESQNKKTLDLVFNDCCSVVKQIKGGIPEEKVKEWFKEQL